MGGSLVVLGIAKTLFGLWTQSSVSLQMCLA